MCGAAKFNKICNKMWKVKDAVELNLQWEAGKQNCSLTLFATRKRPDILSNILLNGRYKIIDACLCSCHHIQREAPGGSAKMDGIPGVSAF